MGATESLQRNIDFFHAQLASWPLPELVPHLMRLLVEAGEPVTIDQIATTGGWTAEQVKAALARHPRVDYAPDGRIAGFGLTLHPTPHAFTFEGRTVYGFCASDALQFPVVLNRPGVAGSVCPATGKPIRVEMIPTQVLAVEPATAVVTAMRPVEAVADIRAYCDLGNFYASAAAAADWLAAHPDGEIRSVVDDFAITRESVIEFGWAPA